MTARRLPDAATLVRNAHPRLRLATTQRPNPYEASRRVRAVARVRTPRAASRLFVQRLLRGDRVDPRRRRSTRVSLAACARAFHRFIASAASTLRSRAARRRMRVPPDRASSAPATPTVSRTPWSRAGSAQ